jgi:hypothetical protein
MAKQTKKLLVAFDPAKQQKKSGEFLIPSLAHGRDVFYGLKSGREYPYGLMVFVGRLVSENDLFARLVDSGARVENVERTLKMLELYVEKLQAFVIGNVVKLNRATDEDACIEMELVAK